MTEIEFITNELEKLEKSEGYDEKYLVLCALTNKKIRKVEKDILDQQLSECSDEQRNIKKDKIKLQKQLKALNKTLSFQNIKIDQRKKVEKETIEKQAKLNDLAKQENRLKDYKKKIFTILKPIKKVEANADVTVLFIIFGFLLVIYGFGVKYLKPTYLISYNCVNIISIILFLIWKAHYLLWYYRKIGANAQVFIIGFVSKFCNSFLFAFIPYSVLCFCNDLSLEFCSVPILISSSIRIGIFIYDIFSTSNFFSSGMENYFALGATLLLTIGLVFLEANNVILLTFAKILLLCAALSFSCLILKKCLIDKIALSGFSSIFNFFILLFATIFISCVTIYSTTWDKNPNSDQSLFTSIMGVYAAVLGGTITLGGVAWTIRKSDADRKENEIKQYKPIFHFTNWNDTQMVGIRIDEKILIPPKGLENFGDINLHKNHIVPFVLKNSDFSAWYFCGLKINGTEIEARGGVFITKEKQLIFYIPDIYLETEIFEIKLLASDLLGNDYEFELFFDKEEKKSNMDLIASEYTLIKIKGNAFKGTLKE